MSRHHKRSRPSQPATGPATVATDCTAAPSSACCEGTDCCGEPAPHEKIAARAREIWETRGMPKGEDLDIWLAAEIEVRRRNG